MLSCEEYRQIRQAKSMGELELFYSSILARIISETKEGYISPSVAKQAAKSLRSNYYRVKQKFDVVQQLERMTL